MRVLAFALLFASVACGSRSPLVLADAEQDAGTAPADAAAPTVQPDAETAGGCTTATEPQLLASSPAGGALQIAIDETHVYWTAPALGTVKRVHKCGGAVETLSGSEDVPVEIAVFEQYVFWLSRGEDFFSGALRRARKPGTSLTTLVGDIPGPTALAVDAEGAFYSVVAGTSGEGTFVLPHGASTPTKVATIGGYNGMAVDATHVYWAFHGISRVPKVGGVVQVIVADRPYASNIAVDDGFVYWTNVIGIVERVPKNGGAPKAIGPHSFWRAITVDATNVYAASDAIAPGLYRLALAGADPQLLSDTASTSVAVDADQIYWAGDQGIWRLTK